MTNNEIKKEILSIFKTCQIDPGNGDETFWAGVEDAPIEQQDRLEKLANDLMENANVSTMWHWQEL